MCSGCSREQSQRDGSFEYSQHMLRGRLVYEMMGPGAVCHGHSEKYSVA